jgi:hypothetical protein
MDYRLVRQFSNNAVDSFFNFFYKIVDFGMILIDVFWAFMDIWYQFFMIFANLWLYLYYFTLFGLDKLTMSGFFTAGRGSRGFKPGTTAYTPDAFVPHNPMYGKIELPAAPKIAPKSSGRIKAAAAAVSGTVAAAPRSSVRTGKKKSAKELFEPLVILFSRIFRAIKKFFLRLTEVLILKLKPVREEQPQGSKSLIDEYMQEYKKKKK